MSLIDPSFVRIVADGLGIHPSTDAAKTLAPDVENRLREIVQEAMKFARHSRRTYITPEDVNNAFRVRNVEPVYGLSNVSDPARFARLAGYPDVYFTEDPVEPLEDSLSAPLPPVPWDAGVKVHWLAVDGKQPSIPENVPLQPAGVHRAKRQRREAPAAPPMPAAPLPGAAASGAHAPGEPTATAAAAAAGAAEDGAVIRAPVRHFLSRELLAYQDKVAQVLLNTPPEAALSSKEVKAVLASLRVDAGLQPLAPYLCDFVAKQVADSLESSPQRLGLLLRAAVCMVLNPQLDLGRYLHVMVPAVLTCLLARHIGNSVSGKEPAEHWEVRERAAVAVAALCQGYPEAAGRVQRQLVAAMTSHGAALETVYGAVAGIAAQGPRAVKALLLPNLIPVVASLSEDLQGKKGAARAAMALRVRARILAAAGHCVYLSGVCGPWSVQAKGGVQPAKTKEAAAAGGELVDGSKPRAGKAGPQLAKLSDAEKSAAMQTAAKAAAAANAKGAATRATPRKRAGGRRGGGAKALASAPSASVEAVPMEEVFGEESDEDAGHAALAKESMAKVPRDSLRPAGAKDNGGKGGGGGVPGSIPEENYLEEAWREEFPVEELHRAMQTLFGSDLEPYENKDGKEAFL